jgi:hypothetical protein
MRHPWDSSVRDDVLGGLVSAAVAIPLAMGFGMFALVPTNILPMARSPVSTPRSSSRSLGSATTARIPPSRNLRTGISRVRVIDLQERGSDALANDRFVTGRCCSHLLAGQWFCHSG